MRRITKLIPYGLVLALLGCDSEAVGPARFAEPAPASGVPSFAASSGGWESGVIVEQFYDTPNPCTGELVDMTFTGQMKVQERGGYYHLVAHGDVTTSDGWYGRFNRTFVIQDDRVFIVRFHDMETSPYPGGPKAVWSVGMGHETLASGVTHDYFEKYGNSGCRGNR